MAERPDLVFVDLVAPILSDGERKSLQGSFRQSSNAAQPTIAVRPGPAGRRVLLSAGETYVAIKESTCSAASRT